MSRRTDRGPLRDMRDYAREAVETFQTASADALENDRKLDWALRYLVLTVGEAATRVFTRVACSASGYSLEKDGRHAESAHARL